MSSPFTFIERTSHKCAGVANVLRAIIADLRKLVLWLAKSCFKKQ